jgi:hypothetical protein
LRHKRLDFPGAETAERYRSAFGHHRVIDIGDPQREANFRHGFSFLVKLVFMFMSELRQYVRVGAVRLGDRGETGSANNSWFRHIIRCKIRPKGGVSPETVLNRIVVVPAGFLARREIGR